MADNFKACLVAGCNGNSHYSAKGARGYCSPHYERLLRHGDPLAGRAAKDELKRFYDEVVLKYDGDECLIWPYYRNPGGYAKIRGSIVSRMLCDEVNGAPPTPKHEAAHSCGNGHLGCVTKRHLSWKTRTENQADRLVHGTDNRGEKNHKAKLTEADVRRIISLRGQDRQADIAKLYGVTQTSISAIQRGEKWGWVQRA